MALSLSFFSSHPSLYLIGSFWIIGILVRVQFQGHFPVLFLDLICGGGFGQTEQLVQRIARCPKRKWD